MKDYSIRWVPKLKVTRRTDSESSVSVNARLERLSSNDLLDLAESSLILASRDLLHARGTSKQLDTVQYHMERADMAAKQASDAISIVRRRDVPS